MEQQFVAEGGKVGQNLKESQVNSLSQEQLGQLFQLQETTNQKERDEKPP